jgi:hypothetical protein
MDFARLKALAMRHGPAAIAGMLFGVLAMWLLTPRPQLLDEQQDPWRIADAALISVREHGRFTSHTARYVAVVSSSSSTLGMEVGKTLILPGTVRYGLDLRRLRREHLSWHQPTRTPSIQLPPLEISGPDVDMTGAREFREGGVLLGLGGSESELDQANQRLARQELLRQARQPQPLRAAREAAMRAVARAFALPLRAAGIEASVSVRFVDPEGRDEAVYLDRADRVEDVVKDRQAGKAPSSEGNQSQ